MTSTILPGKISQIGPKHQSLCYRWPKLIFLIQQMYPKIKMQTIYVLAAVPGRREGDRNRGFELWYSEYCGKEDAYTKETRVT